MVDRLPLETAKKEVEAGHAASLSALVSEAVDEKLRRNPRRGRADRLRARRSANSGTAGILLRTDVGDLRRLDPALVVEAI